MDNYKLDPIFREAADKALIETLTKQLNAIGWRDVKKELPELSDHDAEAEYLLVWSKTYGATLAMYIDNEWWTSHRSKIVDKVTHWMNITRPI
jgi:hypothetical protein